MSTIIWKYLRMDFCKCQRLAAPSRQQYGQGQQIFRQFWLVLDKSLTGGRQDGPARQRPRLGLRLRMRLEPPGEAGIAAVARRHRGLGHAIGRAGGTGQPDMKMIVVPVPWPQ